LNCTFLLHLAMLRLIALSTLLVAAADAFDIECSDSACVDTCTCSQEKCSEPIAACLGDGDCSAIKDCPMQCACGDEACLLACAGKTESPLAMPVAECIQSQCQPADLLKASARDVDCKASKCEEACQCSKGKCGDSISACLADSECSKVQECAMTCECGDDTCMLGCASDSKSALAEPVAQCVASECHVDALLTASQPRPNLSCDGAACEESCKCAMVKCLTAAMACALDPACAPFQDCSFECPCGDEQCLLDCALESDSSKAMPLAECIIEKCHSRI